MRFSEFERIVSQERMERYVVACSGNTGKAMTLYRHNLRLSHEVFTVISLFEVALRNAIDSKLKPILGKDWLRDSILPSGIFTNPVLSKTAKTISHAYNKLNKTGDYTNTKLLSDMEFGIWKYMFSPLQYRLTGQSLLGIFPNKPKSSQLIQYNPSFFFNELDKVNTLRNRIAHHEPICFGLNNANIDTSYVMAGYKKLRTLFSWMGVNSSSLLYGLDHVGRLVDEINSMASAKAGIMDKSIGGSK